MPSFLPAIAIQTVYFDESDAEEAVALGRQLSDVLGRPKDDPLAAGVRIPIYFGVESGQVQVDRAVLTILVPVLGSTAYLTQREGIVQTLNDWAGRLEGGLVFPVLRAKGWRTVESSLHPKPHLGELFGGTRARTIDAICIAAIRCIEDDAAMGKARLFLSHAKVDLQSTHGAAKEIQEYVASELSIQAFFDSVDLLPGESLTQQIEGAQSKGVFVAVRTDHYSSRLWCQAELIQAKRNRLPTLTVEMLTEGETRSGAYAGNGQTVVWQQKPEDVVTAALVAWLRHVVFLRDGRRLIPAADLPADAEVVARAPELLDLVQEPMASATSLVVIHPDPALSSMERAILRSVKPKLSLVTPSTAYRYQLEIAGGSTASALDDWKIGLSLSSDASIEPSRGLFPEHVQDITVALASALISSGAHIAYGGDFRGSGYTLLLNDVYSAYNESLDEDERFLHSYVGATIPVAEIPDLGGVMVHHMGRSSDQLGAVLDPPEAGATVDETLKALYFSDMRRAMVLDEHARIIVAGAMTPKTGGKGGYGGAYPGVVEEAWRSLDSGKPLYVLGGFGGAAAAIAAVLRGSETPEKLTMAFWKKRAPDFVERAKSIREHPARKLLGLPRSMAKLVEKIAVLGEKRLGTDERSVKWNGLTRDENWELFRCIDPIQINALIMRGLLNMAKRESGQALSIELVHGDIRTASTSRLVAVATFEDAPLSGAALAIDDVLGGAVERARSESAPFQSVQDEDSTYDYLFQVNLGPLEQLEKLNERVESEVQRLATVVRRHGFKRVAVVTFGGNSAQEQGQTIRGMLDGLKSLAGSVTIEWHESTKRRFNALKEVFEGEENVHCTLRRGSPLVEAAALPVDIRSVVSVALSGDELRTTFLHPTGTGTSLIHLCQLSADVLDELACGAGDFDKATPSDSELAKRGGQLARLLLGKTAEKTLEEVSMYPMVIQHDLAAAQIPFEMLTYTASDSAGGGSFMALKGGIQRRLFVERQDGHSTPNPIGQDRDLTVLLVDDPTGNLPGAVFEAKQVKKAMRKLSGVKLIELSKAKATKEAFLDAMGKADVLHYAGHGFYRGPADDESGICLADGNLTRRDLASEHFGVRIVILNACEVGRVRGESITSAGAAIPASSFAEFFLASGVEALLGTFWTVDDIAAAHFVTALYERLSAGKTLNDAVRAGRECLSQKGESDWANYVQYGDGRFRLLQPGLGE